MYIFNRVTVVPQLPDRIARLNEIANNMWWSWNTEFLRLFKEIDSDLWEASQKNPVKFLKHVSQERLEAAGYNYEEVRQRVNERLAEDDYYPACDNSFNSIVDALNSIGEDSSFEKRKEIANKNGIYNYTGTAVQNNSMLAKYWNNTDVRVADEHKHKQWDGKIGKYA